MGLEARRVVFEARKVEFEVRRAVFEVRKVEFEVRRVVFEVRKVEPDARRVEFGVRRGVFEVRRVELDARKLKVEVPRGGRPGLSASLELPAAVVQALDLKEGEEVELHVVGAKPGGRSQQGAAGGAADPAAALAGPLAPGFPFRPAGGPRSRPAGLSRWGGCSSIRMRCSTLKVCRTAWCWAG